MNHHYHLKIMHNGCMWARVEIDLTTELQDDFTVVLCNGQRA